MLEQGRAWAAGGGGPPVNSLVEFGPGVRIGGGGIELRRVVDIVVLCGGPRAGASGGGSVGRSRCSKKGLTAAGSVTKAIRRMSIAIPWR